jgi:uncharacterized protein YcbX
MNLSEINIYPVKSTRRILLNESEVLPRGLPLDRRWMLIDEQNRFITARKYPSLATVDTRIDDKVLQISVTGKDALALPLQPAGSGTISVTIWKSQCHALLAGSQADAWFSSFIGVPCRLVQMTDDLVRGVDQRYGRPDDEVSFADGFPLLLIGEASLDDLNSRLQQPVPMQRFRPNVVVAGAPAYAEDNWQRIRIGAVEFEGVKNCSRCIFTTIDADTGVPSRDREPLATLRGYRSRPEGGVFFGQNLIPRGRGTIRIGDEVTVLSAAEPVSR